MDSPEASAAPAAGQHSRRRFLQAAVLRATAVVAGSSPARTVEAICLPSDPNCKPPPPPYQEFFVGNITLGAVLTSYVSAPIGAVGQLTWSISKARTDTRRFTIGSTLTVSRSVTPFGTGNGIDAGGGVTQSSSTKVTNALVTQFTETQTILSGVPPNSAPATIDDTGFLLFANPVLSIFDVYRFGQLQQQRAFKVADVGIIAPWSLRDLRDDAAKRNLIGPATADNILAQYLPSSGVASAAQLGLPNARFSKVAELSLSEIQFQISDALQVSSDTATDQSRTVTTEVHAGISGLFSVSSKTDVTVDSVQEVNNTTVITSSGMLSSTAGRLNGIYRDHVFNTWLFTDDGPLAAAAAVVWGTVTAADGSPVAGAVVTMQADGVRYAAVSGRDGGYAIHASTPLSRGGHVVQCAGVSRIATLGAGPARIDYAGVDRGRALGAAG